MSCFNSALILFAVAFLIGGNKAAKEEDVDFGLKMTDRSYSAVCWYEGIYHYPPQTGYGNCYYVMPQLVQQISDQTKGHADLKQSSFAQYSKQLTLGKISGVYKTDCEKFLDDPDSKPASDEKDALKDEKGDKPYPFKAFSYCLMSSLRKAYGEQAIEAVKRERTHGQLDWMQAMLNRENKFRAMHGVEPLQLNKDLIPGAQEWAEDNAKKCAMEHAPSNVRQYPGGKGHVGENLSLQGVEVSDNGKLKEIHAYLSANDWYQEIKDYSYADMENFEKKTGHFTAMVWKDSKQVGYGMAYGKDCKRMFTVARYFPIGNVKGQFKDNVLPLKKS